MKKFEKILLATVFLCILPVSNLFALSPEAVKAIEVMRSHLLNEGKLTKTSEVKEEVKEYIPGKELSAALARFRQKKYAAQLKSKSISSETTKQPTTNIIDANPIIDSHKATQNEVISEELNTITEIPENYKVVEVEEEKEEPKEKSEKVELKDSSKNIIIQNIKSQEEENQDELVIVEALEAEDSEAWTVPVEKNSVPSTEKFELEKELASNNNPYVPGQLLKESVLKIRRGQNRETPANEELNQAIEAYEKRLAKNSQNSKEVIDKANKEIEELFTDSEKRASLAEKTRNKINSQKANNNVENKQIDDERFNDYISKYNFKMPENYRIILE